LAQVRGHWFPNVRSALERRGLAEDLDAVLPTTTRQILRLAEPTAWYDEGHSIAIFQEIVNQQGKEVCRDIGRDAARYAMVGPWHELMAAMQGHLGGTPRMAFEQMPVLWSASRRDAGTLRCSSSSQRQAITELEGFPYATHAAWVEVWLGHHDALLRHLRFSGQSVLEELDPKRSLVRIRTIWGAPLGPPASNDFRGSSAP
jgi:hypothetical protein